MNERKVTKQDEIFLRNSLPLVNARKTVTNQSRLQAAILGINATTMAAVI